MAEKIESNNSKETRSVKRRSKIKNNSKKEVTMADSKMNSNVLNEFETLFESIKNGRLDARADLGDTTGADRKMLEGVNEMLDAIIAPLNVAAEYVDRISKGDIPEKITDDYKGDNKLADKINKIIEPVGRHADAAGTGCCFAFFNCLLLLQSRNYFFPGNGSRLYKQFTYLLLVLQGLVHSFFSDITFLNQNFTQPFPVVFHIRIACNLIDFDFSFIINKDENIPDIANAPVCRKNHIPENVALFRVKIVE